MTAYANESEFSHPSAMAGALKGIVSPRRRVIRPGTLLFRYGNDAERATRGNWWLDQRQRMRVVEWATLHGIGVPHAVRIMSAVMHVWESADPSRPAPTSTMEYAARAVVTRPLLAYEGESRPQRKRSNNVVEAYIRPATLSPPMTQLFIPGLHDNIVCRDALDYQSILTVEAGASALFGKDQAITFIH